MASFRYGKHGKIKEIECKTAFLVVFCLFCFVLFLLKTRKLLFLEYFIIKNLKLVLKLAAKKYGDRYFRVSVGGDLSRRMRLMGPMIPRVLAPTSLGLNLLYRKHRPSDHFSLFYICAALVTLFGNIVLTFTYMLMIFSFTWRLILK